MHDQFRIRDEIRLCCVLACVLFALYALTENLFSKSESRTTVGAMRVFVESPFFAYISLVSTWWVLQFSGVVKVMDLKRGKSLRTLDVLVPESMQASEGSLYEQEEDGSFMPLPVLLSHGAGVDAFMDYLLKEFSSENMLCVIEVKQFLTMVKKDIYIDFGTTDIEVDKALDLIAFPEGVIPRSTIVLSQSKSLQAKATDLVNKYISSESKYMVNVSGKVRKDLTLQAKRAFEGCQLEDLYRDFGKVLMQLQRLMSDSYHRFVATAHYSVAEQKIQARKRSAAPPDKEKKADAEDSFHSIA
jgi:hypothetical protein